LEGLANYRHRQEIPEEGDRGTFLLVLMLVTLSFSTAKFPSGGSSLLVPALLGLC
jgi:hypothetical protein